MYVASYPGLPMFFNVHEKNMGRPGYEAILHDLLTTYLPLISSLDSFNFSLLLFKNFRGSLSIIF